MPYPLPRWLFVLIGLIIIVVVGSVVGSIVFFAVSVSKQTGVNATDGTAPNKALATARALIATAQANVTAHMLNSTSTLQVSIQANRTICGWRPGPILVSIMTLTQVPIIRAQRNTLLPS